MSNILNDPQVVSVFQSIRPFLGSTGQMITDMTLALGELLSSESSQKAYSMFSQIFAGNTPPTIETRSADSTDMTLPYYFLILYPFLAMAASKTDSPAGSPVNGANFPG